jgi:predicted nucleotidyltransferase
MKTITELKKRIELRKKKLNAATDHIVKQLKKMGALRIILFGSSVTGDIGETSDLDIIVVMPASKSGWEWVNEIYTKIDRKISADIIAYTPDEFERMKQESPFVQYALETGKEL